MLAITASDISALLPMKEAIKVAKDALILHAQGKCQVPVRTKLEVGQKGVCLFMPASSPELSAIGVKIYSYFPGNPSLGKPADSAKMIYLDGTTGEVAAILDGTALTRLRTGALQGAATDLLAQKDAKIGVLIGAGGQAFAQAEAMLAVRPLTELRIFDVDTAKAEALVANLRLYDFASHCQVQLARDSQAAVCGADVITTITTAELPVFSGELIADGAHINGMGSYLPTMRELDEVVLNRADKIFFDTQEGVLAEAGDVLIPLRDNPEILDKCSGELGELLLGQKEGRESSGQITVFKSVGFAALDLVTANYLYSQAKEQELGQEICI